MRINAVHEQIHRQSDDVDVAGALAIAKQRAFDAIGASHHTKLGCGDSATAIVVRVQRQHKFVAPWHVATEPFDDIAINIGRVALDGCWQVQNYLALDSWLDNLHHRFTNFDRKVGFGERETLWRIFVTHGCANKFALKFATDLCCARCDLDNTWFVETENDTTLQRVDRVVKMHNRPWRAGQTLVCSFKKFATTLHKNLNRHIIRNQILLDQQSHEIKIGLTRGWKTNFDLFESHFDERLEHAQLALWVHWIDQRLIAIAQINRAPQRRFVDDAIWPGAVGEHERH